MPFQKSVRPNSRTSSEIVKENYEETKAKVEGLLNRGLFSVNFSQSPARIALNVTQNEVRENREKIIELSAALSELVSQY